MARKRGVQMKSIITKKVKPCNCEISMILPYNRFFFGIPIGTTILCCHCRRKVTRFTEKKAIEDWNKEVSK
jgi:hypothetical protein